MNLFELRQSDTANSGTRALLKVRSSLLPLLPDFLQGSFMQPADVATPGEFQGSDHTTIRTLSFFFIMDSSAFILFVI
ncbi:hypothetical protein B2J69_20135 [Pantoea latae]|uniref:Uncharacterized protein n=1 Tax=Pantoea latae TaxID=1964541 RepID=A0A1V9DA21_9GAMM|nr:hypothetical protein B2J69_20135 [Pantoea latae]